MVTDFWQYDPSSNTWIEFTNFSGGVRFGAKSFVAGNAAYIMNGSTFSPSTQLNELWRFTPETQ